MSCMVVCIALGVDNVLRGFLPTLIYPGGQGYMESPSRVQLESYYNTIGVVSFVLQLVLRLFG